MGNNAVSVLDNQLIGCSLICLLLAGVWGFYWPGSRIWKWIDIIYYPLAIAGACLLFISNEATRELNELRAEQARVEQQRQDHERARPPLPSSNLPAEEFTKDYDFLLSEVRLGQSCRYSADVSCVPAAAHEKIIKQTFEGFPPATSLKDQIAPAIYADEFCRRGFKLVDKLASEQEIGAEIFKELKASFAGLPKDPMVQLGQIVGSEQKFEALMRERLDGVLPRLSEDLRNTYRKVWEESASFASVVYWALSPCLRIPAQQTSLLQTLQRWNAETPVIESAKKDIEDRIDNAKKREPSALDIFYGFVALHLWPFAIVLALALKFAKGVAGVRA